MRLPMQAEPVQRVKATEEKRESEGVEPQANCVCRLSTVVPGKNTLQCVVGRTLWDTKQECTP